MLRSPHEAVPCHASPPASPVEPFAPQPVHLESESTQRWAVTGNAVVRIVTSQLSAQRRLLVAQLPVPMVSTPLANRPQRSAESVLGRLALDHPSPLPGATPVVGEPQHREAALRAASRPAATSTVGRTPPSASCPGAAEGRTSPAASPAPQAPASHRPRARRPAPRRRHIGPQRPAPRSRGLTSCSNHRSSTSCR